MGLLYVNPTSIVMRESGDLRLLARTRLGLKLSRHDGVDKNVCA